MDRRSWPWKRKSSEKSPGETESSDSVSSYSERYSDDQEVLKASTNNSSPNHAQSPEVSSNTNTSEVPESVKSLTEKLSAAILNISAKEELVKQHMKVAEDAVSGWEKAEAEVVGLKQQLEAASKKNSVLEDRIGHLDGALKESVRQLRQSREQQEHKIQEILAQKTHEWESDKIELENQITELQVQLEAAKVETSASVNLTLQSKLEAAEKENTALMIELLARTEDLKRRTLEKELSTRAAESASKQHLEDIKKVAKLEAEFRRLQTVARRASSAHDHKPFSNSVCVESLTDSHSDSGERSLGAENEPNSDLWASALITELDHFKSDKFSAKNLRASIEIDLMDDFLEMERLAAIQEVDRTESNRAVMGDNPLQVELDTMRRKVADYEEKIIKMETEKAELEMVLANSRNQLDLSRSQAVVAEDKLVVLQRQLDSANESKLIAMTEVVDAEEKGKQLEYQLKLSKSEVRKLHQNISILQGQVEKEKALCAEFGATLEGLETARKAFECQAESANFEVVKLSEIVRSLEVQVDEEKKVSSKFKKLECQLKSADTEIKKLNEKIDILESIADEEKAISIELTAKLEASEEKRKAIECQLESAHLEIRKLHEDVIMLEGQIEEKKSLSAELAAKLEAMEAAKMAGDSQLKLADIDIGELREKVGLLEAKVEEETAFSAELVAKQRNLEVGLSIKWQEAELHRITSSNGELRVKQEKDMAMAAEKMAECQRTIASLSSQLKSLASLDDLVVELEKTELNGALPDISNSLVVEFEKTELNGALPDVSSEAKKTHSPDPTARTVTSPISNGKNRGSSPSTSSPSSAFSGFAKLISLSRSSNRAEN